MQEYIDRVGCLGTGERGVNNDNYADLSEDRIDRCSVTSGSSIFRVLVRSFLCILQHKL